MNENQSEKMWLNAMSLIRPSDDFALDVGREVIRMLKSAPKPEPDEYGLKPFARVQITITAS